MLDILKSRLENYSTNEAKFNYLREYCQLLILKVLDDIGGFSYVSFVGGTALRILYSLNRFSEDLDFCLVNQAYYKFSDLMGKLEKELKLYNLNTEIRYKDHKTVACAFIKFNDLLFQVGMTPHKDQKLMVKFEVDQNPPAGYQTTMTMISTEFLTAINHFDLPSLYAGKLHALMCRKYTKGRDYYDLIWYLGRDVLPNFEFLNNDIEQTEGQSSTIDKDNFYEILKGVIEKTDFKKVKSDISPFLVDSKELKYFENEFFISLLRSKI